MILYVGDQTFPLPVNGRTGSRLANGLLSQILRRSDGGCSLELTLEGRRRSQSLFRVLQPNRQNDGSTQRGEGVGVVGEDLETFQTRGVSLRLQDVCHRRLTDITKGQRHGQVG